MILEISAELALIFYIFASFACFNFFLKNGSYGLAQFIMGSLGLIIVLSALGVLFLTQIIKLFLGIHDNISDIRVKTLNPEVSIPIAKKSELEYYNDVIQIVLILLSIVIMLIQFTAKGKSSNANNNTSQMEQSSNGRSITIGQSYEGGIVFYVDESGEHGLMADDHDYGKMQWDDAMRACQNKGSGWHLPTKEELKKLYENKDKASGLVNKINECYWSSSEYETTSAWHQNFVSGNQNSNSKNYTLSVRAVRAF